MAGLPGRIRKSIRQGIGIENPKPPLAVTPEPAPPLPGLAQPDPSADPPPTLSSENAQPAPPPLKDGQLRNPAFPNGLPVKDLDYVIQTQQAIIHKITLARGLNDCTDEREIDIKVLEPVRHLARLVHLLPADKEAYFAGPGGLFRFCLESGLNAFQYAETRILSRSSPEDRRDEERMWIHAAFLAGLYSEALRTLSRISVYAGECGGFRDSEKWHQGAMTLYDWLSSKQRETYLYAWHDEPDRLMISAVARILLTERQAGYLAEGDHAVLKTLTAALVKPDDLTNPLVRIVQTVRGKLIERDQQSNPEHFGKLYTGLHMEPWLIDSMRHLLESKWAVNQERARVWVGDDGVFLVWPGTGADIQQDMRETQCPFYPRNLATMADILLRSKVIVETKTGHLHKIRVPRVKAGEGFEYLEAVKLASPEILFGENSVQGIGFEIAVVDEEAAEEVPKPSRVIVGEQSEAAQFQPETGKPGNTPKPTKKKEKPSSNADPYLSSEKPPQARSKPANANSREDGIVDVSAEDYYSDYEDKDPSPRTYYDEPPVPPAPSKGTTGPINPPADKTATLISQPQPPTPEANEEGSTGPSFDVFRQILSSRGDSEPAKSKPQDDVHEDRDQRAAGAMAELILQGTLTGSKPKPKSDVVDHPFGSGDKVAEAKARAGLTIEYLARMKDHGIVPYADGVWKVPTKVLEKTGHDAREIVEMLKTAGVLQPIQDGVYMGADGGKNRRERYVLLITKTQFND